MLSSSIKYILIAGLSFHLNAQSNSTGTRLPIQQAADADKRIFLNQVSASTQQVQTINFTAHTITSSADGTYSVYATDVDGDGDMDVLSASYYDDKIAWYENDGSENFTSHTITSSADGAYSVYAADVDGDGDMDVLSASRSDDKIAWYENDGSENFTSHTISLSADYARSVYATDVDDDGDMDVLSASRSDDKIAWYENDGNENFTAHTITSTANGAHSVYATDVDGDGDMDVLSASYYDDKIAWYENNGNENFTAHTITSSADGAYSVHATDVDGDEDMDVLSASVNDDKIAWYENDGSENFTAHTITSSADGAYSVYATDVDGDGDMDVFSASVNDDKIAWYENDGSENFTLNTITSSADGAVFVYTTDVDGDGDVDVLSASYADDKIAWYENLVDLQPPAAPTGLVATPGNGLVELSWNQNTESEVAKYVIYGGTSAHPTTKVDSTTAVGDTTKTITGLTNGTTYYYRITAVDTTGNESGYSNERAVIPYIPVKILSVSSTSSKLFNPIGTMIPVYVIFTNKVVVTGQPQLTLETGDTDAVINYTGGSGTDTLFFEYTVSSGENSRSLDYVSTSALILNGGTIKDTLGNNTVLVLPEPGASGSLSANTDIIVDGVVPKISINPIPPSIYTGQNFEIKWTASDNFGLDSTKLYLSTDSLLSWIYIDRFDGNKITFLWHVPDSVVSAYCAIKGIVTDSSRNSTVDTTDFFTIVDNTPPIIDSLSLSGNNQELGIATDINIFFNTYDNVGITDIDLQYSIDGGNTWSDTIETGLVENDFTWFVPDAPSTNASIRLISYDAVGLSDTAIVSGLSIIVVYPTIINTTPVSSILTWRNRQFQVEFSQPMDSTSLNSNSVLVSSRHSSMPIPNRFFNSTDNTLSLEFPKSIPSSDTLTILFKADRIANIFGYKMDGNGDQVPGDDYTMTYYTIMLADYDTSQTIDAIDLADFIQGLITDDYYYELGPVSGSVPYFISTLDSVYNIEDVMAFAMMWNWYVSSYNSAGKHFAEEGEKIPIVTSQDSIWIELPENLLAYEVQIEFEPGEIVLTDPVVKSEIKLSSNNRQPGIYQFIASKGENSQLIIPVRITGKKSDITISFRAIGFKREILSQFTQKVQIETVPERFALHQNYPNPFNPVTTIRYDLPQKSKIRLIIYNIRGQEVTRLVETVKPAGYYEVRWDGRDRNGRLTGTGMYFYSLSAESTAKDQNFHKVKKLLMLK